MAKFKPENFFIFRSVSPSALVQNNLITFAYKSPAGVHDGNPLVFVTEKRMDRFYGINIHYDMSEMQDIVTNTDKKVMQFLEKEYYKKYPENKKKLNETRQKFNKGLITEDEYKEFSLKIPKNDLERFSISGYTMDNMRCYIYQRMNYVSKLVWKT